MVYKLRTFFENLTNNSFVEALKEDAKETGLDAKLAFYGLRKPLAVATIIGGVGLLSGCRFEPEPQKLGCYQGEIDGEQIRYCREDLLAELEGTFLPRIPSCRLIINQGLDAIEINDNYIGNYISEDCDHKFETVYFKYHHIKRREVGSAKREHYDNLLRVANDRLQNEGPNR